MIWMLEHLRLSWRFLSLSSCFWIRVSSFCSGWMFISSYWSKPLIWVPVSFPSLLVPCTFSFISLFIAFTVSSILQPYSANFVSIPITSSVFWTVHLIGWLSLCWLVVFFLELRSVLLFDPFFLSQCTCYVVRGGTLGIGQGGATHVPALWCCLWGRGLRGNSAVCSALGWLSVTSSATHK